VRWRSRNSRNSKSSRPAGTLALLGALLVTLLVLAFLQYRWIAQLGDAEKSRAQARLEEASRAFCDDLDRELDRAIDLSNGPPAHPGDEVAFVSARLTRWKESALFPQLVSDVFLARVDGEGRASLFRLDPSKGEAQACDWPASLEPLRPQLPDHPGPPLRPDLPAIVVPLGGPRPGGPEAGPGGGPPQDVAIVLLDLDWITRTFLPERARAHFGGDRGLVYRVTVLGSAPERRVLFSDGPDAPPRDPSMGDVTRPLFLQRSFRAGPGPGPGDVPDRPPHPGPGAGALPRPGEPEHGPRPPRPEDGEAWQLVVRHPSGSVEALVGGFRARNLALSFGVLALLGTSALLVLASSRRSSRLARQQMDFVAAVTHELRTPVTAIRSAGQNLSAGIVTDPERVRWYGDMIEMEGSRLSETVARVLAFARIGAGKQEYARRPLKVAELVEKTLAGYQLVLAEKGLAVESSVAEALPPLSADPDTLELALRNLLDNAVKYGADGGWVAVCATASPDGSEILLTVSDRGRGVSRKDVPHLFEPFFRGEDASTGGVQGSGLGLAVVEHVARGHGGRVTVRTERGKGSDFTIHLPVSPGKGVTEEAS
jgi:signal transduction histidine kinase